MTLRRTCICLFLSALATGRTLADPAPKTVGFMGVLNSSSGARVSGTVSVHLALYSVATGGSALWSEDQNVVATNGLFSTALGTATPFPVGLDFSSAYFVGVTVSGEAAEMTPRIPLQGVPYALFAQNVADGSVTSAKLASDSDSLNKVAGGAMTAAANGSVGVGSQSPGPAGVDQQQTTFDGPYNSFDHWQSFTAGKTGNLSTLALWPDATFNGVLNIYAGEGTAGTLLYSNAMQFATGSPTLIPVGSVAVTAGQVYTWHVHVTDSLKQPLSLDHANVYAGGKSNAFTNWDYAFETFTGPTVILYANAATGNVGIGTTAPAQRLDVAGTAKMTGFQMTTAPVAGNVLTADASGNGTWQAVSGGTSGGTAGGDLTGSYPNPSLASLASSLNKVSGGAMTSSGGNIGIGTSPSTRLDIAGTAKMTGFQLTTSPAAGSILTADASGNGTWQPASASGGGLFAANGANIYNTNTGGVGIGTNAPGAKLDVRGDVKLGATGQYYAATAVQNTRSIWGNIFATGSIQSGSGFTVARSPGFTKGVWRVTFTEAFVGRPAVAVTPEGADLTGADTHNNAYVDIYLYDPSTFMLNDDSFAFIVMGAR